MSSAPQSILTASGNSSSIIAGGDLSFHLILEGMATKVWLGLASKRTPEWLVLCAPVCGQLPRRHCISGFSCQSDRSLIGLAFAPATIMCLIIAVIGGLPQIMRETTLATHFSRNLPGNNKKSSRAQNTLSRVMERREMTSSHQLL